jgi:hypothetical protein
MLFRETVHHRDTESTEKTINKVRRISLRKPGEETGRLKYKGELVAMIHRRCWFAQHDRPGYETSALRRKLAYSHFSFSSFPGFLIKFAFFSRELRVSVVDPPA